MSSDVKEKVHYFSGKYIFQAQQRVCVNGLWKPLHARRTSKCAEVSGSNLHIKNFTSATHTHTHNHIVFLPKPSIILYLIDKDRRVRDFS